MLPVIPFTHQKICITYKILYVFPIASKGIIKSREIPPNSIGGISLDLSIL